MNNPTSCILVSHHHRISLYATNYLLVTSSEFFSDGQNFDDAEASLQLGFALEHFWFVMALKINLAIRTHEINQLVSKKQLS